MKFCIVGAGAIGGFVGAKLAAAGEDVTFIARWKNLDAIRARGMTVKFHDGSVLEAKTVKATDSFAAVGHVDCVILALKAHQVESVVHQLEPLFGPKTTVITMQNGIPFWYFVNHGGDLAGTRVETVDPHGVCLEGIPNDRIIGCVVYPATELVAPGVVQHIEGERFPLGELDGSQSNRIKDLSDIFAKSGLKAPVLDNIRNEIWLKLWGNLTFNPISALTHATLVDICENPFGRALATNMMREAQAVAEKLGASFRVPLEKRIEGAAKVGKHKTSMLQDVEAGREIEIDALVGAVVELGIRAAVPTPTIQAVYQASKLLAATMKQDKLAIRGIALPSV
ncbi:2-dehydropantoate 2-reductase [Betaproteobacteria bacterium UKL13-2]|jgi:2-dehydropantoate 2-reductase|nr:2-dehydropantoate 2-reductase [Betaproteobacteria bacterium UKL13-2]HCG54508.1 oxidoreductase [Betaproteobacteria bacterium]